MRPILAFAMILALAVPLGAASAQPPEPMLGRGIDLAGQAVGVPPAGTRSPFAPRPRFGVDLEYGGTRGGGNGIRVSSVADNAFGVARDESPRRVGQAPASAATGTR